ncbi:MAG: hypothetical protein ACTTG7_04145 [Aggregatibacter segnis]|nr:hypothetical protein [Aggregatibacter segnis]
MLLFFIVLDKKVRLKTLMFPTALYPRDVTHCMADIHLATHRY